MHLFDVVIVTYNSAAYIKRCIQSIECAAATFFPRIIIVDNASCDHTKQVIQNAYPAVTLIENSINRGFAAGVNQGIKQGSAPYIVVVNPDAFIERNAVQCAYKIFESDARIAALGGQLLDEDGALQHSIAAFPNLCTELFNKSLLRYFDKQKYEMKRRETLCDVDSLVGACMFFRRSILDEVGSFDEDFFLFFEETEICYRLKKAGYRVMYHPDIIAVHAQGRSAHPVYYRSRIEYSISRYLFFYKCYGMLREYLLLVGLTIKYGIMSLVNGILYIVSAGSIQSIRKQFFSQGILFLWHICGFPSSWRLKGCAYKPQNAR